MEVISEEMLFELRWGGGEAGGRRGQRGIRGSQKAWKVLDLFENQKEERMAGASRNRNERAEGRRPGCTGCLCGHQQVLF